MASDLRDVLDAFAAVQTELRNIPADRAEGAAFAQRSVRDDVVTNHLDGLLSLAPHAKVLGCRLLHWNPELRQLHPGVYLPLDTRIGSKPWVFFAKLHKTK